MTGLHDTTVSQALRYLRAAQIVSTQRDGRIIRYALAGHPVRTLLARRWVPAQAEPIPGCPGVRSHIGRSGAELKSPACSASAGGPGSLYGQMSLRHGPGDDGVHDAHPPEAHRAARWPAPVSLCWTHGQTTDIWLGMAGATLGMAGNQAVALYKRRVGRRINSLTLIVEARHSWLDACPPWER